MLAAMLIIFYAKVIKPGHMKILNKALFIRGALLSLFQE
jgi:hypothetical protein